MAVIQSDRPEDAASLRRYDRKKSELEKDARSRKRQAHRPDATTIEKPEHPCNFQKYYLNTTRHCVLPKSHTFG